LKTIYVYFWPSYVQNLLNDIGFNFLWTSENVTKSQLAKVIVRLHDQYYQQWNTTVTNSPKLSTYNLIKGDQFNFQKYLDCAIIDK